MNRLDADHFRRIALGLDGASEGTHMNHPDFRVEGRIFATLHEDLEWGMVKLTPEQQQFVRDYPRTFVPESGAWGRGGCTAVHLSTVEADALGEAMTLARQNAVEKSRKGRTGRTGKKR